MMRWPGCERRLIYIRARNCHKHSSCILLLLTGVCICLCETFALDGIHSGSVNSARSSRRETRKAATRLPLDGYCVLFCMQTRRCRPESGGQERVFFESARKRLCASFLLCRIKLFKNSSGLFQRPPPSTSSSTTPYTRRQCTRKQISHTRAHGGSSLLLFSLWESRSRQLTGAPTAEAACATQLVDVCFKDRLHRADSAAGAHGCEKNGGEPIKSAPSMALNSVRRYPQGNHANETTTRAGGRKRRALEKKNIDRKNVHSLKTATEAKQWKKVKLSTPIFERKAQGVKVEDTTTYEGSRGLTSKQAAGTSEAPATKKKQTKQGATSSTKENDESEINDLFLAHRKKALHTGKYLGAHISAAGGPQNAPVNCLNVGGQAFAFFLKNQRRWDSPPISEESAKEFKNKVDSFGLDGPEHILPHGSYLINLANPDTTKRKTSYNAFLDDLRRCEKLGIQRYVFHPGSTVGACDKSEGIANVACCLNEAMAATQRVTILLENMAGQKNMLCSTFEDLRDIIEKIETKDRVGVCLDTCHLFAAGFDIRTTDGFERVMKNFDAVVGMKYLKGMHINDSKSELSSGLDRHEHLGKGAIGIAAFKYIMQHPLWFKNMPLIIETPEEGNGTAVWRDEIKKLYEFIDM